MRISGSYPQNIFRALGLDSFTQDQVDGLEYVISTFKDSYQYLFNQRFKNSKTLLECANSLNVNKQCMQQREGVILNKLKRPENFKYIKNGLKGEVERIKKLQEEEQKKKCRDEINKKLYLEEQRKLRVKYSLLNLKDGELFKILYKDLKKNGSFLKDNLIPSLAYSDFVKNYPLSKEIRNSLIRWELSSGYATTFDFVLKECFKNPLWYKDVRNLGKVRCEELYGYFLKKEYIAEFEYKYLMAFI